MTPTLRFRDLNPLGRLMIVAVALLTFGIAAVAFITSYDALYDWVADQRLYSDRVNQLWPLLLDAGFIVAQLAAILAGILRAALHGDRDVHRGWPITAMVISGGLTVWFNILHADQGGATWSRRLAAALPPVLMMLAFEIDVQIVRWVMKALGRPMDTTTALSPTGVPAMLPGPVPGTVYRTDAPHGWPGAHGELPPGHGPPGAGWWPAGQPPTWPRSQDGQPGHRTVAGNGAGDQAEVTKRGQVETYLAGLDPAERDRLASLGPRAAAREVTAVLGGQGTQVSERYVTRILDERTAARRGSGARRRRPR
jgi:Protein of unknown function (DUF2637)